MVKVNSRNISAMSDLQMDNGQSELQKYFSYVGPGDGLYAKKSYFSLN
jgi:hypothetical protein